MNKLKVVLSVAVVIAIAGAYVFPKIQNTLGVNAGLDFFNGIRIGPSPATQINELNAGTCYIWTYATTIAASSTALVDCQARAGVSAAGGGSALTGVASGDFVNVTLATTTAGSTFMGLNVIGATASNTAGYIQLRLVNLTGDTYTWPTTGTASGTASYISGN